MSLPLQFGEMIAPITTEEFFRKFWEKEFLHVRRDQADYYDNILTLNDLDHYFQNNQLPATFMKVTKPGEIYLPEEWTRLEIRQEYHAIHVIDLDKLFMLFRSGATLVISGGHKRLPNLTRFCTALEQELRFRVQINLYITPPHSQGLRIHYDAHDVFALQISGSKQWRLYDMPEKLPVREQRYRPDNYVHTKPDHEFELHAGDLLYMPRGLVHDANTTDTTSIHLTLGFVPDYWFHLVDALVDVARNDPEFRQALPHGFTSESDKADFIREFRKKFEELVQDIDIATLLDKRQAAFVEDRLVNHQGRFTDLMLIEQLRLTSIVCKRPHLDYVVTQNEQQIKVTFGEHQRTVPHYLNMTLQTILQAHPFAVGDLQGLITDQGKLELVANFVKSGFLKIDQI